VPAYPDELPECGPPGPTSSSATSSPRMGLTKCGLPDAIEHRVDEAGPTPDPSRPLLQPVVGYSLVARMKASLTVSALHNESRATRRQRPPIGSAQLRSRKFIHTLADNGLRGSEGREVQWYMLPWGSVFAMLQRRRP
jgi:hypothetical protein